MEERKLTSRERNKRARYYLNKAVQFRSLWYEETNPTIRELLTKKIYSLIDMCNSVAPKWMATFQKLDCGQILCHPDGQMMFSEW